MLEMLLESAVLTFYVGVLLSVALVARRRAQSSDGRHRAIRAAKGH